MPTTPPVRTIHDDEQTEALAAAMLSVATNLPQAATEIAEGRLSPARQGVLAALLTELGTLLREHADLTTEPTGTGYAARS
jgi:hypothetical protein